MATVGWTDAPHGVPWHAGIEELEALCVWRTGYVG